MAGDRVNIASATVNDFFGQTQLGNPAGVMVVGVGEAPPAPVPVTPEEVKTGGARAAALESVLVRVSNVTVASITPPPAGGDATPTNEFEVGAATSPGLRVNDLLYLTSPFPTVGEVFTSITGILELRNSNSKIEPRSAGDVVAGPPVLVSFSPPLSYAQEGTVAQPTFPTALTVALTRPAAMDTFVTIGSSDPSTVDVPGGGVTAALHRLDCGSLQQADQMLRHLLRAGRKRSQQGIERVLRRRARRTG
jgi:hypothetical protein